MNTIKKFLNIFFSKIIKSPKVRSNIDWTIPVSYKNRHKGRDFLILGTGASLSNFEKEIKDFIREGDLITIGVNSIEEFLIPDYIGFSNRKRFLQFGKNAKAKQLLSILFTDELILKNCKTSFDLIKWKDISSTNYEKTPYFDENETIFIDGTSTNIMMIVAYQMGAKNVYVAGVDGWTKYLETKDDKYYHYHKNEIKYGNVSQEVLHQKIEYWAVAQKKSINGINKWAKESGRSPMKWITPCEYEGVYDPNLLKK